MKKQEIIKKAFGEHYDKFKPVMDEDGWVPNSEYWYVDAEDLFMVEKEDEDLGYGNYIANKWRPAGISDLLHNNGWIRIESKEDLPDDKIECWITQGNRLYQATLWNSKFWHSEVNKNESPITHYQPIIKPKPPLH